MARLLKTFTTLALGSAAFIGSFAWDMRMTTIGAGRIVAHAEARVGRPLTPVSYAGVARRTTRRAVVATGAAAAAKPVVVAPAPTTTVVVAPTTQSCTDTVNPDGSITRTCR